MGATPSCLAIALLSLGVSCLLPNRWLWERPGREGRSQEDRQAAKHPLPIFLGPVRSVEAEMARAPACATWCQKTPAHPSHGHSILTPGSVTSAPSRTGTQVTCRQTGTTGPYGAGAHSTT